MSLPGVFTPVIMDGKVLVDGGIASNLPVDAARAMGAEQVIAVDVGTPPAGTARDLSALSVYSQTFDVLAKVNVKEQIARMHPDDLLITPDLGEVTTAGFSRIQEAVDAGEAAARKAADQLRRFAVSDAEWAAFLREAAPRARGQAAAGRDRFHHLRGPAAGRSAPAPQEDGHAGASPLDFDVLAKDLEKISQAGEFESVGFHIVPEGDRNHLVVDATEKKWGPTFIRFGIGVETRLPGRFELPLHRQRPPDEHQQLRRGVEDQFQPRRADGHRERVLSAAGADRILVRRAARPVGEAHLQDLPSSDNDEEIIRERASALGVDVGASIGNYGEVRLGWLRGHARLDNETAADFEVGRHDIGGGEFSARLDQLDSVFFPTKGSAASLTAFVSRTAWEPRTTTKRPRSLSRNRGPSAATRSSAAFRSDRISGRRFRSTTSSSWAGS
jgi:NTE family protein